MIRRRTPIGRWLLVGLIAVIAASGCTAATGGGDVTVTTSRAVAAPGGVVAPEQPAVGSPPAIEVVEPVAPAESDSEGLPTPTPATTGGSPTATSAAPTPSTTKVTPTRKPVPEPVVTVTPRDGATGILPLDVIRVKVSKGALVSTQIYNPGNKLVYHGGRGKANAWAVAPELGYGKRYRVVVTTKDAMGKAHQTRTSFVTVTPRVQVSASIFPSNLSTVGVGQPIRITFSSPIGSVAAKRTVEKMIQVKTHPVQGGAFRWFSDTELRWRPARYFRVNATVRVYVNTYGKNMFSRAFGLADTKVMFRIGRSMITTVDAKTHQLAVRKNGRVIRTMPVSLGTAKYPTYNGVHIVTEKFATKVMDSTTWGLRGAGQYRTTVKWATRISNTGEFVHGAPWSEWAQGNENVSHGCINVSDPLAKWFHDIALPGDVVIVKNSTGPTIKSWDGFGDWNIPFGSY